MKKQKVLVIDDEQIVLDSVRKILPADAFEVDTTLSGQEGIKKALRNDYDIILTDVRMPDTSGKTVLREVKRAKPSLPVIIITGYSNIGSARETMQLGASDYLEKPFTPEELLNAISEVQRKAKQTSADESRASLRHNAETAAGRSKSV